MARLYRLLSPGVAFATLGLVILAVGARPWFYLRGGLVTTGIYTLVLQVAVSALLLAAIDDLSVGGPALAGHRFGRGSSDMIGISARPISFIRALVEFYRWPFLPVLLLGFGIGATLSALAAGSLVRSGFMSVPVLATFGVHKSEAALGAILVVGAALLWWGGAGSYFGWLIGFSAAVVLGQVMFVPDTIVYSTVTGWGGFTVGLCLLRLLAQAVARVRQKRSQPSGVQAERNPTPGSSGSMGEAP